MKHLDLVERLILGDQDSIKDVVNHLIVEDEESDLVRTIGDTSLVHYCMKIQQFIEDELDMYVFKGWEEAEIVGAPRVEKFWVTFNLLLPPGSNIKYVSRFRNNHLSQNEVQVKKTESGAIFIRIRMLKQFLDQLESRDKDRSEQLADEDIG